MTQKGTGMVKNNNHTLQYKKKKKCPRTSDVQRQIKWNVMLVITDNLKKLEFEFQHLKSEEKKTRKWEGTR